MLKATILEFGRPALPWMIIAQANVGKREELDPIVLFQNLTLLAGVLLVLAGVVAILKKWYERTQEDEASSEELIAHFRMLKVQGELSPEEFAKIQAKLGHRAAPASKPKVTPTDEETPDKSEDEGE